MNENRKKFILGMIWLAEHENLWFAPPPEGETLVERTVQYAGTAVPRVTKEEVEQVLAEAREEWGHDIH